MGGWNGAVGFGVKSISLKLVKIYRNRSIGTTLTYWVNLVSLICYHGVNDQVPVNMLLDDELTD